MKFQRNAIFEALVAGGLNPKECVLDDDAEGRITHVPSQSYFLLERSSGHYTTTAVVAEDPSLGPIEAFTLATVKERVQLWAQDVKRDIDTPDLWAENQRGREIVSGARYEDLENTPFTSDEQAEIVEQLRRINELMKRRYSLSEAQMQSLDAKLDSVKTAAGRIGRKDWVFLFYGVIFNMFVTALLPRKTVWDILIRTLDALRDLFGGGLLPQLPPMA